MSKSGWGEHWRNRAQKSGFDGDPCVTCKEDVCPQAQGNQCCTFTVFKNILLGLPTGLVFASDGPKKLFAFHG